MYVPGLGDGYDIFRRHALKKWKRNGLVVSFVPMRWHDRAETFQQKLTRINEIIDQKPDCRTVLVGESAGGAVVVGLAAKRSDITKVITICGKNVGAGRVGASVYRKNMAFKEAMRQADLAVRQLELDSVNRKYVVFYSPADATIRRVDTELPGADLRRLPAVGHLIAIFLVLYFLHSRITAEATR